MKDFVDVLELRAELRQFGIANVDRNFELLFQEIAARDDGGALRSHIEKRVVSYFTNLELSPGPTLYDIMVLSLRAKDMIATFNWDPFLWAAACRVSRYAPVPRVAFLHGNVAVGYCQRDPIKGPVGATCRKCGGTFEQSRLLFPVADKDYTSDEVLRHEWIDMQRSMKAAYFFTVFGYSAPTADVAAIELLRSAWGKAEERNLEQTEIIDIQDESTLRQTWSSFVHTHHYGIVDNYRLSYAVDYPRRSCEAFWQSVMELKPYEPVGMPDCSQLEDLVDWLSPFIAAEHSNEAGIVEQ